MFDLPPDRVRRAAQAAQEVEVARAANGENTQLSKMWASLPKTQGVDGKEEWIKNVLNKAGDMDISCVFHHEKPLGSDKEHEYLVFSTNRNDIQQLTNGNYKNFPVWLKRQNEQDTGIVLLDKLVIDVTDIDRQNYFAKNSYIMRYVQNMAIVKTAFENEGYPIPDHVSRYVVSSIWELDQMRANPGVPQNLRERYAKTYREAVADYAQSYANKYKLEIVPHKGKHEVKETYFRDNHIPVVWDVVGEKFWNFIQKELKAGKYPEFIYYKPDNAFLKTKNLAKEFERLTKGRLSADQNFWSKDTGKTKYHISYPLSQEAMFCNMRNDYNTLTLESKVPMKQLIDSSPYPLQTIYIPSYDMSNWNNLCRAGNIAWSVNDGTYGDCPITSVSTMEEIPVLHQAKDEQMVAYIVDRLSREMRDYVPISSVSEKEKTDKTLLAIHKVNKQIEAKNRSQNNDIDR